VGWTHTSFPLWPSPAIDAVQTKPAPSVSCSAAAPPPCSALSRTRPGPSAAPRGAASSSPSAVAALSRPLLSSSSSAADRVAHDFSSLSPRLPLSSSAFRCMKPSAERHSSLQVAEPRHGVQPRLRLDLTIVVGRAQPKLSSFSSVKSRSHTRPCHHSRVTPAGERPPPLSLSSPRWLLLAQRPTSLRCVWQCPAKKNQTAVLSLCTCPFIQVSKFIENKPKVRKI
jgi:hypothetical protein